MAGDLAPSAHVDFLRGLVRLRHSENTLMAATDPLDLVRRARDRAARSARRRAAAAAQHGSGHPSRLEALLAAREETPRRPSDDAADSGGREIGAGL